MFSYEYLNNPQGQLDVLHVFVKISSSNEKSCICRLLCVMCVFSVWRLHAVSRQFVVSVSLCPLTIAGNNL